MYPPLHNKDDNDDDGWQHVHWHPHDEVTTGRLQNKLYTVIFFLFLRN